MQTPWTKLVKEYGAGFAAISVIICASLIFLLVVAVGVIITKISWYIK